MLPIGKWKFCRNLHCDDSKPILRLRDRFAARAWLQRFKADLFRMIEMRRLLSEERMSRNLSRIPDGVVIEQVADLMAFGRLHVHIEPAAELSGTSTQVQSQAGFSASEAEPLVPFPISERRSRPSGIASRKPAVDTDPPTFPSDADFAAQAATLVAAAEAGMPACYI